MRDGTRADSAARVFVTVGALLPYWRLLTFSAIYVTDDFFASDIFNGELPGRVLIGQLIRHGRMPVWTNQLCSGLSLAGSPADPIGLASFALLSPAAALDLLVIVMLLVAAHGAYGLARRFGADRAGAALAGVAFAGSGYIACQLKHLSIISTVVWLPVGLLLIDRALAAGGAADPDVVSSAAADPARPTPARRAWFMAAFGLVFADQALAGFPQSAYICALVYGSFASFRAIQNRRRLGSWRAWTAVLGGLGVAAVLGTAAAAVVLLPLAKVGNISDRSEALGYVWSTRLAYWPPNLLTFVMPYINGDIANNTYMGPPFFWEDYGYVGAATFLLAFYGAIRDWRRPAVAFSILMTVVAYFFVLGSATPVFHVAYLLLPGMNLFRFPTRFLIVVDLGLALLGGVGLTGLGEDLKGMSKPSSRLPRAIVLAVCVGTAIDLFVHQPRQNPMVSGKDWLAAPASVDIIRADGSQPRTFTPRHRDLHRQTFPLAHGWADVQPYFDLRDVLEPNTGGGLWSLPSADCYTGISPRWYVNLWGDHNREGSLMSILAYLDFKTQAFRIHPALARTLSTYGVSHVLSPFPEREPAFTLVAHERTAYVYRVSGAQRVRFVRAARHVGTDQDAAKRLLAADFDPAREILLQDAPDSVHPTVDEIGGLPADSAAPRAVVEREDPTHVLVEADAPADGFLLLADTFYPGWTAEVDGRPTPLYRADIAVRGIALPKGQHEVRFSYDAPGFTLGLQTSIAALAMLLVWAGVAAYVDASRRTGSVSAATR